MLQHSVNSKIPTALSSFGICDLGKMSFFLKGVLKNLLTYRLRCCACSHLKSSWWSSFRSSKQEWFRLLLTVQVILMISRACDQHVFFIFFDIMLLKGECVWYKTHDQLLGHIAKSEAIGVRGRPGNNLTMITLGNCFRSSDGDILTNAQYHRDSTKYYQHPSTMIVTHVLHHHQRHQVPTICSHGPGTESKCSSSGHVVACVGSLT